MSIVLLGINHRSAPVTIRERLSISCGDEGKTLEELRSIPHVREVMFLATCNRIEVLANMKPAGTAIEELKTFITSRGNLSPEEMTKCLYVYRDEDAIRHLFRVASSLDSMIMGEPQILGQLKDAYRLCVMHKTSGVILNKLLHRAFSVAKRVRTETAIANNAVSVSFAAVKLAKKIFGALDRKKVLLVGAGEMAQLAARHLADNGIDRILFANRTYENAVKLAHDFHGLPIEFDQMESALGDVDIVISSTASPEYVISRGMMEAALCRRKNRLMFLIDLAVPRDIDPGAGDIDTVYLYNIDDLQGVVDDNIQSRLNEARKAEAIIDEEVADFSGWFATLEVVPTIVDLKNKAGDIIREEIVRSHSWMKNLDGEEKENIEILVNAVVNKILHDPVVRLKEESRNGGADSYVAVVKKLFKLE
ncbi:MAG TPA: glutamyl-tRNA reductase [Syntrophales bacterium]|nr:glutamyl-tRNA reductase [Syntrophales bacterium]HPQ44871.1 glutamyl-tRNA reductase [Syntrophales bacterium]